MELDSRDSGGGEGEFKVKFGLSRVYYIKTKDSKKGELWDPETMKLYPYSNGSINPPIKNIIPIQYNISQAFMSQDNLAGFE